jgi:hypothetical protein
MVEGGLEDAEGTPVGTVAKSVKVMNKLRVKREGNPLRLVRDAVTLFA